MRKIEDFLDEAFMIFRCADCRKIMIATGYEEICAATDPQRAAEERKLFCRECE